MINKYDININNLIKLNIKFEINCNNIYIYYYDLFKYFDSSKIKTIKKDVFISQYSFLLFLNEYYPKEIYKYFTISNNKYDILNYGINSINIDLDIYKNNEQKNINPSINITKQLEYKMMCIEMKNNIKNINKFRWY